MRTEKEMLDLIVTFAKEDEQVRAVIMNGSRNNPNVPRDIFQDYDVIFIVTDLSPFVVNRSWISHFGDLMIMQTPAPVHDSRFSFLMQFMDGNRIDLTFYLLDHINQLEKDSLSLLLLDKDGIIDHLPPPNESDYLTKPPSAKQFVHCCNEFWWVSTYIAKGLWRGEVVYAKFMFEQPVRDMLLLMMQWHIGVRTNFSVNPGKCGKYFNNYIEPERWKQFLKTYSNADQENSWQALFTMIELFRNTAIEVAEHFHYVYPYENDQRVTAHLYHVRALPREAEEMYA